MPLRGACARCPAEEDITRGLHAALAHDHALLAPTFSGEVVWDAADPTKSRSVVDVDARRLIVDDDRARVRVGLAPGGPQKDRDAVDDGM